MTPQSPPSEIALRGPWRAGRRIESGHSGAVLSLALATHRSRPLVISGGDDGSIRRFDALTGSSVGSPMLIEAGAVHAVVPVEVGERLMVISCANDGGVRLHDVSDGRVVALKTVHSGAARSAAVGTIDERSAVASAGIDGTIRRLDLETLAELGGPITKHTGAILAIAMTEVDGRAIILSGGSDGVLRRFDASSGQLIDPPLQGHTRAIRTVGTIRMGGRFMAVTGGSDGLVLRFDLETGETVGSPIARHAGGVRSIALGVLDDQAYVISGGTDGLVCCHDLGSAHLISEQRDGHAGSVLSVAADLQRRMIVSAGDDGTMVAWRPSDPLLDARRLSVTPRLVSDVAAERDLLGSQPIADALVDFLTHPHTAAPLSVAVKGPWGSGKSTLMGLVRNGLDPVGPDGNRAQIGLAQNPSERAWFERFRFRLRSSKGAQPGGITAGSVLVEAGRPSDATQSATVGGDRVTVWFNPWTYQSGEQVWAGFAHELIEQVSARLPRAHRERFWLRLNLARVSRTAVRQMFYRSIFERAVKPAVALAVVAAVLIGSGFIKSAVAILGGGVAASVAIIAASQWRRPAVSLYEALVGGSVYDRVRAARDAAGTWDNLAPDPGYGARSGYVHLIQTDIQRVLALAATPDRPLTIFVDDLDRCSPRTVLEVLEAINLFLAGELQHCVFVLGIEPAMLAAHIETSYEGLIGSLKRRDPRLDGSDLSWSFLEKLIQLSVRVPETPVAALPQFVERLLGRSAPNADGDDEADGSVAATPQSAAAGLRQGQNVGQGAARNGSSQASRRIAEGLGKDQPSLASQRVQQLLTFEDERVRSLLTERMSSITMNPRRMKRVVNLFVFHSYIAAGRGLLPDSDEALIADLSRILDLVELLINWPEYSERLAARDASGRIALLRLTDAAVTMSEGVWDYTLHQIGLRLVSSPQGGTADATPGWRGRSDGGVAMGRGQLLSGSSSTDALRLFLRRAALSTPLMSELL